MPSDSRAVDRSNSHHAAFHRCSLFCAIPPHILDAVARNGTAAQRTFALDALIFDASFRNARTGLSESRRPRRAARRAARRARVARRLFSAAGAVKRRTVSDAGNQTRLPGAVARTEGQAATGDPATDEAYDYLGDTWDLYFEEFGRNSLDDEGMPLNATVHFGQNYDNAFWDGSRMVFGDGDNDIFERFTIAVDIVGHELSHGVIEHEPGLIYWGQPGALNESLADVFGSLVKQRRAGETAAQADWLIGEGLFKPGAVNGVAIRSLKDPGTAYDDPVLGGKDPQPAHMNNFVRTFSDNGGVHINSGIPNKAFYLAATKIGGFAWEGAGLIWYKALLHPSVRRVTNFRGFAATTLGVAAALFGASSPEQQAVREAWTGVGIIV